MNSLMLGQTYVGNSIWDALGFELVAKRAFDTMLILIETLHEFDDERVYFGAGNADADPVVEEPLPAVVHSAGTVTANGCTNDASCEMEDATGHIARALADKIAT